MYAYYFEDKKLTAGLYASNYIDNVMHLRAYDEWKGFLEEKYGSPDVEEEKSEDPLYSRYDREFEYEHGNLELNASWKFDNGGVIEITSKERDS